MTNASVVKVWDVVRRVKSNPSLLENSCGIRTGVYSSDQNVLSLALAVGYQLEAELSYDIFENISSENLETAAEMFFYLYACPTDFINKFMVFYDDLFRTQTPYQMILTLNRMIRIKSTGNNVGKAWNEKLFKKAASLFDMKYEDIQSLLPRNQSFINEHVESQNILSAKGMFHFFAFFIDLCFFRYSKYQSSSAHCHQ